MKQVRFLNDTPLQNKRAFLETLSGNDENIGSYQAIYIAYVRSERRPDILQLDKVRSSARKA